MSIDPSAPDRQARFAAAAMAAGELAADAVPFELALGAADAEAGPAVMAGCLAQALAAGHRAMLRMTVAVIRVLDRPTAAAAPEITAAAAPEITTAAQPAEAKVGPSAARLAGTCGRVMEEVRLGLLAVAGLRPAPLGAAAQALKVQADAAAALLAAEANVADLAARADLGFLSALFGHELAAGHGLTMRLYGAADRALDAALGGPMAATGDTLDAERLMTAAARMAGRVRRGVRAQTALSNPTGGGTGVFRPANDGASRSPAPAAAQGPHGGVAAQKLYAAPGQARGRLANGNPAGDFMAAPRCGACTRAGTSCRQPAMANGRCRFHGGKSTGPRTREGLARSRAARLIHGGYSAEIIDLQKFAGRQAHRIRQIRHALAGAIPAGHGVDPHDSGRAA